MAWEKEHNSYNKQSNHLLLAWQNGSFVPRLISNREKKNATTGCILLSVTMTAGQFRQFRQSSRQDLLKDQLKLGEDGISCWFDPSIVVAAQRLLVERL